MNGTSLRDHPQDRLLPPTHRAAAALERALGDPEDPASAVTFAVQLEADEREEAPLRCLEAMRASGYTAHYVPPEHGGDFHDLAELYEMIRALSRRDMAPALSSGINLLAGLPVWACGTGKQRERLAELLLEGGLGSFGLSESASGGDVLSATLSAEATESGGWRLNGTKWPIGNGHRGTFATVFARTGRAGPRAFSTFFVDKSELDPRTWHPEPRVRTSGLRAIDLSGLTFEDCELPGDALVGVRGRGLDIALRTLQASRIAVTAMAMGLADTALRITVRHTRSRQLYGAPVYDLPVIREQVVSAFVDMLVMECVGRAAVRGLAAAPNRSSLWSSVTKYLLPAMGEEVLNSLSGVMAARNFLREGVYGGMFQKVVRDGRIISVFEGTGHVQLHVVCSQLPQLVRGCGDRASRDPDPALMRDLFGAFAEQPLWRMDLSRFRMSNGGTDEVFQGWPSALEEVEAAAGLGPAERALAKVAREVDTERERLLAEVDELTADRRPLYSCARGFGVARRYCLLFAATACVRSWLVNREDGQGLLSRPEWAVLALRRVLSRMRPDQYLDQECVPAVEEEMLRCWSEESSFALLPIPLGGSPV